MWNRSIIGVTQTGRVGILGLRYRGPRGLQLSDKRPETSADIVSRSKVLLGAKGSRAPDKRGGYSVDLGGHMAECDANYHRLKRLFPNLRTSDSVDFALYLPSFKADVVFTVGDKGRYTTVLHMAVRSDKKWMGMATTPEMAIRVYHDAQSAEVISYQNQNRFHGKYDYPNARMRQRDEKVQVNRFLGEFLTLCLTHGASNQPISL